MDGHFVPNITIGPPVVESLKAVVQVPLDVHLMIASPDPFLETFAQAGAAMISVHVEAVSHLHRTVQAIKALGVRAGVVINPSTPVVTLEDIAADVDFVLVMSVNPGFGGQSFIDRSLAKVAAVRALLDRVGNPHAPIEIDGGIDLRTAPAAVAAGATILVAGSAIFKSSDPEEATRTLKAAAQAALPVVTPS
jgi:ribulose-phosphate 3-epimerase